MGNTKAILSNYTKILETYSFLKKSQWWSAEQLQEYQDNKLSDLITHAYMNVPYYHSLFTKQGVQPSDITSTADLHKLPLLTREVIRENQTDMKAQNYHEKSFEPRTTGGSTGTPLHFYVEKGTWLANHMAFNRIYMDRAGYRLKDRIVSIAGSTKIFQHHPLHRTIVLSSFHMTDQNLQLYVSKIKRFKPKYITAYPSALTILSKYISEHTTENIKSIQAVFCHGETIFDWQRKLIEQTFDCRIFDQYGHREQSVLACTCEKNNEYHIFPEYGVVELIDEHGKPVTKENTSGEIVATGLHTHIFPFIRYKTGDIGIYTNQSCECGRKYPLIKKILGRTQEFLVSKNDNLVSLTGFYSVIPESSKNVKECQLYQDTPGEVVLHIVTDSEFADADIAAIKEGFHRRFKNDFSIQIQLVDSIPRLELGKFRFLVQKLPIHKQM